MHAWHLLGRRAQGVLVAYLRVVDGGVKDPEVSIGRVVTRATERGNGLGRELMQEGMRRTAEQLGLQPIRISAQAHLDKFYGSLGFVSVSAQYLEDGIPHVEMLYRTSELAL
jgi:ElaA protein